MYVVVEDPPTTGNGLFADSFKLSVKDQILSAKASPTGFRFFCRRSPVGEVFVGNGLFTDSHVAPVGESFADSHDVVGEGDGAINTAKSPSPTATARLSATASPIALLPVGEGKGTLPLPTAR
jgi:hypothetical protein